MFNDVFSVLDAFLVNVTVVSQFGDLSALKDHISLAHKASDFHCAINTRLVTHSERKQQIRSKIFFVKVSHKAAKAANCGATTTKRYADEGIVFERAKMGVHITQKGTSTRNKKRTPRRPPQAAI